MIVATPTQQKIRADFAGVEAHAGIRPEDGSNAIAAAAAAISRMELGRLDEETTANVGLIEGGTSGNVVPGHCGIVAETRSLDAERAAEVAGEMTEACAWGASEHGCDVDVQVEELFRGYELPERLAGAGARRGGPARRRARAGAGRDRRRQRRQRPAPRRLRLRPARQRHRSTSTPPTSRSRRADLDKMLEVCEGIVARAGRRGERVSGRLQLRRGVVVGEDPLTVEVDGERRPAWADTALLGEMREGDEVVVNVAALDLGLGSGGFDVVHVNLTRGLDGRRRARGRARDQAQLHLAPAPGRPGRGRGRATGRRRLEPGWAQRSAAMPVLVLPLHGHLAPAAWAAAQAAAGARGSATCRPRAGRCPARSAATSPSCASAACSPATSPPRPPTAASTRRSRVAGALDAAGAGSAGTRSWSAPARGSSAPTRELGHGGMAALDSAHAALSLGLPRCSRRGSPPPTRASATAASATTP